MTARIPSEKYRIPRPIMTAVRNFGHEIPKVPAERTNILNGVGGGSKEGTITARTPCRRYQLWTLANLSSAKLLRRKASPPFRPTAYKSAQPMTDPTVVNSANFTILPGSLMAKVMSKTSFTSGKETNDESHTAKAMSPNPPYGNRVFLSQADIASKFINLSFGGIQRPKSEAMHRDGSVSATNYASVTRHSTCAGR